MKLFTRTAALTVALAFSASPALAQAPTKQSETTNSASDARPAGTPKPANDRGAAKKLAAPGQYCKAASKQRVEGQKGTAFSACVKAQAKLRKGTTSSPREACKDASKKRVAGQKGTAFSACVKAGAKVVADQQALSGQA